MDVFDLPVHPAADVFPMLADDELTELTNDIAANGLQQPLVVKGDQLIDGRNRREACKRLGLHPEVVELNGVDPVAYIVSTNINRRHLSKGQRTMVLAKLYPEGDKTAPGKKSKTAEMLLENKSVSGSAVSQARLVLRLLPTVADAVLAGSKPLAEAYAEAQAIKAAQASEGSRLARLRDIAPDLADLVVEGRLTLIGAESEQGRRVEEQRQARQIAFDTLDNLDRMFDLLGAAKARMHFADVLREPTDRKRARTAVDHWIAVLTATREVLI